MITLPPLDASTFTVVIPARNEAAHIERALNALCAQRERSRVPFDVIVFANNCDDGTAAIARRIGATAPRGFLHVAEGQLPAAQAHVGTARKWLMDAAAQRFLGAGCTRGTVASTDADSVVDARWVENTVRELHAVDAVTGTILPHSREFELLPARVRDTYASERFYQAAVAALEDALDPLSEDPAPRHGDHVAASFAVSARAYAAAGGMQPLPRCEDIALYCALKRVDARVRHSPNVIVRTSLRRSSNVGGGFATRVDGFHTGGSWLVEHPQETLGNITRRAGLRKLWRGDSLDAARVNRAFCLPKGALSTLLRRSQPFGVNWERIEAAAAGRLPRYPRVRVAVAGAVVAAFATAALPTRSKTASGAG